jgi:uncharacterized protein
MRMIFVNLPVKDLKAAKAFYEGLGLANNPQFTDDNAACMVIEENISVMLLTETYFKTFIVGDISRAGTEVLNCISATSREDVDNTYTRAIGGGGKPWRDAQDLGFMYNRSFQDLDGHVWEVAYMDMAAFAQAGDQAA